MNGTGPRSDDAPVPARTRWPGVDQRGFTLIELLVVIIVLGLLVGLVGPRLFGRVGQSKQVSAQAQIELFGAALDHFRLDAGRYPTTEEGLNALVIRPPGVENWVGPYLKKDVPLLRDFLAPLPRGVRAAFEFRSSSWFDDAVYETLRAHDVALVTADTEEDKLPAVIVPTAPYAYARLRREAYEPADLRGWAEKLGTPGWEDLWVFFKHEDAGAGPKLAKAFVELAGGE